MSRKLSRIKTIPEYRNCGHLVQGHCRVAKPRRESRCILCRACEMTCRSLFKTLTGEQTVCAKTLSDHYVQTEGTLHLCVAFEQATQTFVKTLTGMTCHEISVKVSRRSRRRWQCSETSSVADKAELRNSRTNCPGRVHTSKCRQQIATIIPPG